MIAATIQTSSILVSFAINSAALAALFRFLTGTKLRWRTIWPGSLLGGAALTVLQLGAGLLLSYTPSNPLLATFAIFIGLLLWFRLIGIVMLVAAAWIAVARRRPKVPLLAQDRGRAAAARSTPRSCSPRRCGCAPRARRATRRPGTARGGRPGRPASAGRAAPRSRHPLLLRPQEQHPG